MVRILAFAWVILLFSVNVSLATPSVGHVGGPGVKEGQLSIEWRNGYTQDNDPGNQNHRVLMWQFLDYGFNDTYAMRLVNVRNKFQGGSNTNQGFTLENRFHVIKRSVHGWDGGFRVNYTKNNGENSLDAVTLAFFSLFPFNENWEYRQNFWFATNVGSGSEQKVRMNIRQEINKKYTLDHDYFSSVKYGLELLNAFGRIDDLGRYSDQDHQLGIYMNTGMVNDVSVRLGYRNSLSRGAEDHSYELTLRYVF
ncbi:hypothetical protein [Marinicella sp. W31]|uniref:hypothetical protein n=1 Tax=Marinicella sp. W31 TaxID=3023713 RepID=UPI0037578773